MLFNCSLDTSVKQSILKIFEGVWCELQLIQVFHKVPLVSRTVFHKRDWILFSSRTVKMEMKISRADNAGESSHQSFLNSGNILIISVPDSINAVDHAKRVITKNWVWILWNRLTYFSPGPHLCINKKISCLCNKIF